MKFLLTVFLICFGKICLSQLSPEDIEFLRKEITRKVNDLRQSVGVSPLKLNDTLKAAAELHSNYMVEKKVLTHDENKSTTATPKKRVIKCKGKDFDIVGENILVTSEQIFPLNKKSLIILADEMFLQWKNSPGHYANMIDPEYIFADIGIKADIKKSVVYATQVFGKKGFTVSGQISENAFGITNDEKECEGQFGNYQNIVANLGNGINLEFDTVKIYNHDLYHFRKIFANSDDGLTVDIIARSQLICNQPNALDFSPVYDGVMLKPVYRDDLLNGNTSKSNYHLITTIGIIPPEFKNIDYSISVILIKKGKKCKYLVPTYVPSKDYTLRFYEPALLIPDNVHLVDQGIINTQDLLFEFEKNLIIPVKTPKIEKLDGEIFSVQIQSYSSVEGSEELNRELHDDRARYIEQYIRKTLKPDKYDVKINAKENWDKMLFQFNYYKRDSLGLLTHDSIKKLIASGDSSLVWDSLLFEQRQSKAYINYFGQITKYHSFSDKLKGNLRYALATNNMDLANLSLYELFSDTSSLPVFLFENDIFDQLLKYPELVQNAAANLSKVYHYHLFKTTEFLHHYISNSEILSNNVKNNLINLYTLTGYALLDNWDVSSDHLAHVLHPDKISKLDNTESSSELKLNEQLTFIQYLGQINDNNGTNRSFEYITDYFKQENLTIEQLIDLTLFFNSWSMYRMTTDILADKFSKNELNESAVFILAHTLNLFPDGHEDIVESVHEKAAEMNSKRWCDWIFGEFQIMRNHKIKRIYCDRCNGN